MNARSLTHSTRRVSETGGSPTNKISDGIFFYCNPLQLPWPQTVYNSGIIYQKLGSGDILLGTASVRLRIKRETQSSHLQIQSLEGTANDRKLHPMGVTRGRKRKVEESGDNDSSSADEGCQELWSLEDGRRVKRTPVPIERADSPKCQSNWSKPHTHRQLSPSPGVRPLLSAIADPTTAQRN